MEFRDWYRIMAASRKRLIDIILDVNIAYDAAAACIVDAAARGEQAAFTLVAASRLSLERQGDQSAGE
jgi:hypothetical protein